MKAKTRKIATKKPSRRLTNISPKVAIVGANHPVVKHFKLLEHKHTGKVIHHRHTSHGLLALMLLFVGMFLYFGGYTSVGASGSVSIGLTVIGPAPSIGAEITYPVNGTKIMDNKFVTISGTCPKQLFVVIKNNDQLAGSTICYENNTFSLQVQLNYGTNVLTAMDYDNYNQAGPTTGNTIVTIEKTPEVITPTTPTIPTTPVKPVTPQPILPENPSIIIGVTEIAGVSIISTVDDIKNPGDSGSNNGNNSGNTNNNSGTVSESNAKTCEDYDVNSELPTGGDPHVAVVCIPRLFLPEVQQSLGYVVWGGTPPYSVTIDWGTGGQATTLNVKKTGYNTAKFTYTNPGIERINFNLKDNTGTKAVVQTAVQISGIFDTATNYPDAGTTNNGSTNNSNNGTTIDNGNSITGNKIIDSIIGTDWFKTPVPMYLLAVAITFGFWGGDIFDRKFGAGRIRSNTKRPA